MTTGKIKIINPDLYSMTDKCIVLDLDECLIHSFPSGSEADFNTMLLHPRNASMRSRLFKIELYDLGDPKGGGDKHVMWGITRPHLKEFILFIFAYFKKVAVWSAGKYDYVHAIVKQIFFGLPQPCMILTYNDIKINRRDYTKPLDKVMRIDPDFTEKNTFFLDDKASNFYPYTGNGVTIPRYDPPMNSNGMKIDDIALTQFRYWLSSNQVISNDDIRQLYKGNIFTTSLSVQPAIAPIAVKQFRQSVMYPNVITVSM